MTRNGMAAIAALSAALLLAGCADWQNPNETGGTLLGAAAGGLIGSQFGGGVGQLAATGAGVLLGGMIGSSAGASVDRADRLAQAAPPPPPGTPPANAPLPWLAPGASGTVTAPPPPPPGAPTVAPLPAGRAECREFQQTITIAGQRQQAYGTACRQPDGTWRIVR